MEPETTASIPADPSTPSEPGGPLILALPKGRILKELAPLMARAGLHPAPDFRIKTLPGTISEGHPDRYPEPITAHDYLFERLVEIGLIKK